MRETGRHGTEAYLKKAVATAGGATRKWVSPGRRGVPDQIVIWTVRPNPRSSTQFAPYVDIHFVETKSPDGRLKPHQAREHKRLRDLGCKVYVLGTEERIDHYVGANR